MGTKANMREVFAGLDKWAEKNKDNGLPFFHRRVMENGFIREATISHVQVTFKIKHRVDAMYFVDLWATR